MHKPRSTPRLLTYLAAIMAVIASCDSPSKQPNLLPDQTKAKIDGTSIRIDTQKRINDIIKDSFRISLPPRPEIKAPICNFFTPEQMKIAKKRKQEQDSMNALLEVLNKAMNQTQVCQ